MIIKRFFARLSGFFTEGFPPRKDHPRGLKGFIQYAKAVAAAKPKGLDRIMRIQPVFALGSAIVCILLFRKGFEHVPVAIAFVIFSVFYLCFRFYIITKKGKKTIGAVSDLALLYFLNDMLTFVFPFYLESTTFPSRNMLFTALLLAAIVITNWSPLYQKYISPYPLAESVFYAFGFFAVLNFVFPILFAMRNIYSLAVSAGFTVVCVIVFVLPYLKGNWPARKIAVFIAGVAVSGALMLPLRSLIPPAPLRLMGGTACLGVENYRPVMPFRNAPLAAAPVAYYHTAIFAPRGLREKIDHTWYHSDTARYHIRKRLFTVHLPHITGGRKAGFNTWSLHKTYEGRGRYTVEVWTAGGQLVGSGSFRLR